MSNMPREGRVLPAPIVVILCFGAGLLAHFVHPVRVLPELGFGTVLLGLILCILSLAVGFSGVREFQRKSTPTSPFKPTTALVTTGVFSRTRNPMYLGFVGVDLGVAVAINSLAVALAGALMVVLLQIAVIKPEEQRLSATFGQAFEEYRSRTRRWL